MHSENGQRMRATAVFVFPRMSDPDMATIWVTDSCSNCGEIVTMSEGAKHEYERKRRMIERTYILCETCMLHDDDSIGREDE